MMTRRTLEQCRVSNIQQLVTAASDSQSVCDWSVTAISHGMNTLRRFFKHNMNDILFVAGMQSGYVYTGA